MCMQTPVLLLTMTCVAVYAYHQPYQKRYINILEIVILVDQLLLLMMAPTSQFKVSALVHGVENIACTEFNNSCVVSK